MVLQINDLNRREGGKGRLREKFKSTDNLGNSEYEIQCDGSPTGQHFNLLSSRSLPASLPQICCFVGFLFFFICLFFLFGCLQEQLLSKPLFSIFVPFLPCFTISEKKLVSIAGLKQQAKKIVVTRKGGYFLFVLLHESIPKQAIPFNILKMYSGSIMRMCC